MAEIKSTMEMVMERAAKMAAEADSATATEDFTQTGMRLAADFLQHGTTDLPQALGEHQPEAQVAVRNGMSQTLLRNIVLPRDERLRENAERAIDGLLLLAQSSAEVSNICAEIKQILGQYNQHQEQVKQQLEDAMRAQLEQQLAQQGVDTSSGDMSVNPAMHPQYQEELGKAMGDLNSQYNQALDQRKEMVRVRLAP